MSKEIFLSYDRRDVRHARRLYQALRERGFSVFWDEDLMAGEDYRDRLAGEVKEARSVVVLWSKRAVKSRYVRHEARIAERMRSLVPAVIDDLDLVLELPLGSEPDQCVKLVGWAGESSHPGFEALMRTLEARRTRPRKGKAARPRARNVEVLGVPRRGRPVTHEHLYLVHSSWRAAEYDQEWGEDTYQFQVIVFGDERLLDRIEKVTWYLDPAYEEHGVATFESTDREGNFGFYELAWGYQVVVAAVTIRRQAEPVILTRFVNLEEGDAPLEGAYY